jgi:adenylate kinase family enzyme
MKGLTLVQLERTVVIGNGGSGKSRLAHAIADKLHVPAIDLDHVHWEEGGYGARRDESVARRLVAEASAEHAWVIEGVYGWLARVALPRATALIWLDLPWEACRAGLMDRGLRRNMTEADHAALIAWSAEYWTRDNANSYHGHLRLFEAFGGAKCRLQSRPEVNQFIAALPDRSSN